MTASRPPWRFLAAPTGEADALEQVRTLTAIDRCRASRTRARQRRNESS
jgi:hypothetical protein